MFRLLCKAGSADGFYGGVQHFSTTGLNKGEARAGQPFALLADGLRYDMQGRMHVTKDFKPILPRWVIPLEAVKPIDPKVTPHVIMNAPLTTKAKRVIAAGVLEAAPMAWPENQKAHRGLRRNADLGVELQKSPGVAAEIENEG